MNIIIPMAGMGKRMRPHTLLTPKPLLRIAGKSIVERIVEDLKKSTGKGVHNIHFVIGNFGKQVEESLISIAESIGAKGHIHYQDVPLGTAHAVYCAEPGLRDEVIVAFADTMFFGDFQIADHDEAIIWTKEVENPQQYGVVVTDEKENVVSFAEKPVNFVSNKAIIGIYYFKDGIGLRDKLKMLLDSGRTVGGEYQLTDTLRDLLNAGTSFKCKVISDWLDCGNKEEFLTSARKILEKDFQVNELKYPGSKIFPPVYIAASALIENSTIGPYAIIEDSSGVKNSRIQRSIIGIETNISDSDLRDSLVGNNVIISGSKGVLDIGDYSRYAGN